MNTIHQRTFWLNLSGACIVAIIAATPLLMSGVMDRGFEIAKQCVADPLAVLAFGAMLLAGGWHRLMQQGAASKIAAGALALFLLLAVVSTGLSENPEVAVFGGYYRREGLLAWGIYGAFFFAVLGWAHRADRMENFLDVLLASSVIPAVYVLQQRLGMDFYLVGSGDPARPGGTMGNPLFLGVFLGLLLPLTAARYRQAMGGLPERVLWLVVAALQVCGLLVTQSRGPLLATIGGLLLFACCCAGRARARFVFVFAFIIFALTAASLVAINTFSGVRQWAQGAPVVSRLVFNLERDATAATQAASRGAAVRLDIWGAGVETYVAAPLERKLLGYGPESAYMNYFSHMPASAMRHAGYGAYTTYDRLHADVLDIVLNFGLLAWLLYCLFFGVVMFAAARALWGLSGRRLLWIFITTTCIGGVFFSTAATLAGFSAAAVPAFGLGIGAGWFLFMLGCAWRALTHGVPLLSTQQPGRWIGLAALISALLVFWIDAQVNIPVLTTRLVSFAIAALILNLSSKILHGGGDETEPAPNAGDDLWLWGIAFSCVAGLASCLPITLFDASSGGQAAGRWLLRMLPILAFLFFAAMAAWAHARRSSIFNAGVVRSWLMFAAGLPLIYTAVHLALMVRPDSGLDLSHIQSTSIASYAGPVFIFAMCVVCAIISSRSITAMTPVSLLSRVARRWIWGLAASVVLVASLDWRAMQADIASTLAMRAAEKQPQLTEQFIAEAIRLLPYERHYRRQLVFDLLERAVADIRRLDKTSERIPGVLRNLAAAESAARQAALLFPRDPWVVVALANVLQVEGLRVLRPLDSAGGLRAAQEAHQLFAQTHRMFPSEPLLLRNWAQLLADQGNVADAYVLLDRMEHLVPNDLEPYFERIAIAALASDHATIEKTLSRARLALEPQAFNQLQAVATAQQK